ncbi:MAG: lysine--tRNA ligase [Halobacteriales archaeon]|nr:lysine--tRNA ligase [Halobacteriales archaeon]
MSSDENLTESMSDFWADEAARRVAENDRPPVVKGGVSPSGVPHIGNFNEVLRGAFVVRALERRDDIDEESRQVFTSDDRDPLRRVPDTVLSPDGELVELDAEERDELSEHLGKPYVDVPSPFADTAGAPDTWAEHFASFLREDAERLEVPVEFVSNDEMYDEGKFDEAVRTALTELETSREVIARHQRTAGEDYVPFMPICAECGRITPTVSSVNIEDGTVDYVCDDAQLAGEYTVEGCGHRGTATFREGKLPWRFEWPAQWWTLGVGFEPFGKDHAEGSWESGVEIAKEVYGIEPPEPLVYEFFLVDGDKMSASEGNVYTVSDVLRYVEPPVLRYFFALDPKKQRDLSLADVHHLVNDFDRVEDAHYGREEAADETEELYAERVYEDLRAPSDDLSHEPVRPPYTFSAMVGVAEDDDARLATLLRSGHLPDDATEAQKQDALRRVELARNWALDFDNQYAVRVLDEAPDVSFDDATCAAFEELADVVESGASPDEIQNTVFETAREHDLGVGGFFSDGYRLFLGQESGPKLGPLLAALDRDFVVERLREA